MVKKEDKQIKSLDQLKKLASEDLVDCHIRLNGGCISSKQIQFAEGCDDGKDWSVFSSIDGEFEEFTEAELGTETNIISAIEKGALFLD